MKKYFKKAIASVMAIALMVVSVGAIPAHAATNAVTIYFKDNQSWGTAYYYACTADTGSTIGAAWTGTKMTSIGSNWYSATITSSKAIKVVLNNGAKPKAKQTSDVVGTDGKGLQPGNTYYLVPGTSTESANVAGYNNGGITVTTTTTKPADFPATAAPSTSSTASSTSAANDTTPKTGDTNTAAVVGTIGVVSLAVACVLLSKKKVKA
jgi:LPXTG-motif cell wall-anchored protein